MKWAVRNGRVYRAGDQGFEEAWASNMRDVYKSWAKRFRAWHDEKMATDPAYRAQQEASDAEYERIFNAERVGR